MKVTISIQKVIKCLPLNMLETIIDAGNSEQRDQNSNPSIHWGEADK
jgi:hypothetical protein